MSKLFLWMLSLSLLCSSIASWLSPRFLSWYASPPVPIGVHCDDAIAWAMDKLIFIQLGGVIVGAMLGVFFFLWLRGNKTNPSTQNPS